jgi:hypothetical protein
MVAVSIMIYLGRSSKNRIKSNILNNNKKENTFLIKKNRTQKEIKYVCNKYKRWMKILKNKKEI